jgi:hypothetical protein
MCDWGMANVASRELRNSTRDLLERVEGGEELAITVDGPGGGHTPAGSLATRCMPRAEFVNTSSVMKPTSH